jgi:hypothetical protein
VLKLARELGLHLRFEPTEDERPKKGVQLGDGLEGFFVESVAGLDGLVHRI